MRLVRTELITWNGLCKLEGFQIITFPSRSWNVSFRIEESVNILIFIETKSVQVQTSQRDWWKSYSYINQILQISSSKPHNNYRLVRQFSVTQILMETFKMLLRTGICRSIKGLDDRSSIPCKDINISLRYTSRPALETPKPMGNSVLISGKKMAGAWKLQLTSDQLCC
jgi:hypothetical protein